MLDDELIFPFCEIASARAGDFYVNAGRIKSARTRAGGFSAELHLPGLNVSLSYTYYECSNYDEFSRLKTVMIFRQCCCGHSRETCIR